MTRIRLAVIGAGRLGGFHAEKAAAHPDVELVGIVDPAEAQRQRVAAACGARAWADHRAVAERIDAAIVAAPTSLHHALGMDLARRGVHLLIEKPLCPVAAEAEELVETAQRHGVVLQVGHVERFNPAWQAAVAHVPNPKYIEAVRASGFTFRGIDVGVVLDLMIHDIDLVLSLVRSPVRRVEALGLSVLGGHEDVANARLHFESGCVATLSASRVSHEPARWMSIWSARGHARIDFGALSATVVRPSEAILRRQFDATALNAAQIDYYREHLLREHFPRESVACERVDALACELDDFVQSIRAPRAPRVCGREAAAAVAVAERILEKIHLHAWDDRADGPIGPRAVPRPGILPTPHWALPDADVPQRRQAG
ncbi:MAG: Gfo/Idh/MocA family oxidoreductase [Pirellulales bacterium]|nr:Gfo/Idh/MocA family oxidoreductase [Pirellulales bacterium]